MVERDAARPLCAGLKWLAAELGRARDTEVLQARLTADLAALVVGPVEARITAHFTAELARARQAVLRALDGQRYFRLLNDLDALLAGPPLTSSVEREAGRVLAKPVRQSARRLRRALAAVPGAADRDTAIHQARRTRAASAACPLVPVGRFQPGREPAARPEGPAGVVHVSTGLGRPARGAAHPPRGPDPRIPLRQLTAASIAVSSVGWWTVMMVFFFAPAL